MEKLKNLALKIPKTQIEKLPIEKLKQKNDKLKIREQKSQKVCIIFPRSGICLCSQGQGKFCRINLGPIFKVRGKIELQ